MCCFLQMMAASVTSVVLGSPSTTGDATGINLFPFSLPCLPTIPFRVFGTGVCVRTPGISALPGECCSSTLPACEQLFRFVDCAHSRSHLSTIAAGWSPLSVALTFQPCFHQLGSVSVWLSNCFLYSDFSLRLPALSRCLPSLTIIRKGTMSPFPSSICL